MQIMLGCSAMQSAACVYKIAVIYFLATAAIQGVPETMHLC
uniref:Uncharacterized protein n=1 Tax=Arundo donax TaxID=35708 RepID=A0A0A9C074_ARUDO